MGIIKTGFCKLPKSNHNLKYKAISIAVLSSTLVACGGGGGGGGTISLNIQETVIPTDYDFGEPDYNHVTAGLTITDNTTAQTQPTQPVDLSGHSISPGTYRQQTETNVSAAWDEGYKGAGITVGVVDGGVNPDQYEFYDTNTGAASTRIDWNNARGFASANGSDIEINSDYEDIDVSEGYHGSHVASILGGREFGVAPEVTILPVNVFFNNGLAYSTAIHRAVDYAAQFSKVVNASISGQVNYSTIGGASSTFNAYLTTLKNNDVAYVSAAGNGGDDNIGDPIGADHFNNHDTAQNLSLQTDISNQVLHVIALNNSGSIASFSNYPGSCDDVAPGADEECIFTTMDDIQGSFISAPGTSISAADGGSIDGDSVKNGTSMATPAVSGGLAVLLSAWNQLTPKQAVSILKQSANNTGLYSDRATYGVGLMDLQAALQPLGDLQSSSSSSSSTSHPLGSSSVEVSSELGGLSEVTALSSVAYFDDYDRDFAVDVSSMIEVKKQAVEWNGFWSNQHQIQRVHETKDYKLRLSLNPNSKNGFDTLSLTTKNQTIHFANNSSNQFYNQQFVPNINKFVDTRNVKTFGPSLGISQNYSDTVSFHYSHQSDLNTFNTNDSSLTDRKQHSQTVGLSVNLTDHFRLGLSTNILQQDNQALNSSGSGTLSFGDQNTSQYQALNLSYLSGQSSLFAQLKNGVMTDYAASSGSYVDIKDARYAELRLGMTQNLSAQKAWGVQAFNNHSLMDSTIALNLPVGLTANGDVEYNRVSYQHKGSIAPDSYELFYQSALNKNSRYQFNAIKTPDDFGLGLYLTSEF